MKRALVIVNPAAGEGRPRSVADEVRQFLRTRGWETGLEETEGPGHASELASELGKDRGRVVVVGGDGTLREAVEGLGGKGPPVGLIPVGKANVVARELGIPQRASEAIRLQESAASRSIDVGTVEGRIFLAMVGIGYDGAVVEGVDRLRHTRLGGAVYRRGGSSLIYGLAGLPALLRPRPAGLRVTVDGTAIERTWAGLVIANTETYALGWSMTPGADPSDGRLDHQLNRRSAPWFVLWTLGAAILHRRLPRPVAEYGSGREYEVTAREEFPWQIDGDSMPRRSSLRVGIRPGYARLLAPDGASGSALTPGASVRR